MQTSRSHGDTSECLDSQRELWNDKITLKESVAARLREGSMDKQADRLSECHNRKYVKLCTGCRREQWMWGRCNQTYCPMCMGRISFQRFKDMEWFSQRIAQPKHVVLTFRNDDRLTRQSVARRKKSLARLRRSVFAKNWRGGSWAMEVTNEGRGWHLHFHLLVDADWVDASELAIRWRKFSGDGSYIVKVIDVREKSYLHEVARYAVKGTDLAGWDSETLCEFVRATERTRTWGVFGSMFKLRAAFKEAVESCKCEDSECECGHGKFIFKSEDDYNFDTARREIDAAEYARRTPSRHAPVHDINIVDRQPGLL
jgi:hypothetical protein